MNNKQNQSILCPNCGKLISHDELYCPYCGLKHPGSRLRSNFWTRGFKDPAVLIRSIVYLNIGMYILSLVLKPAGAGLSMNPLTFLAPDSTSILLLGATGSVPINHFGALLNSIGVTPIAFDYLPRWWTLLSANYLHGGVLHIFFNMVALRQLSPFIIREYGTYRMFIIYTVGGILGFVVSYLAGVRFTIGASAAVCSLIGGALYYGLSRGGAYGQAVYRQVGGWALGLFLFGFMIPGINNWAHGGGILGGVLMGHVLGYHEKARERFLHKTLAGICAGLTVVVLGWSVLTGLYYLLIT